MKKLLLLCLTALFALTMWAADFTEGGIYYNFLEDGSSVAVTWGGSDQYASTEAYIGDIIIPSSVQYEGNTYTVSSILEYAFYWCGITSITIPETVTSIGTLAIAYCNGLTSVTLPESIETINCRTLEGCSNLEEITIGSKVTSIGYWAFFMCESLDRFYSLSPEPPTCEEYGGMNIFEDTLIGSGTLYVPKGSKEKYESADTWKKFGNIIEIDESIIPPTVETISVTDITNSTATLHGTVSAGSEEILETGFQYWVNANAKQTIVATSISDDEISSTIQRLESATEYTFRAYAKTASDITYGDQMTFTTTDYDFCEDGIYYSKLTNSTVVVQPLYYASTDNNVAYEGELNIPSTVTHENTTYRVVMIDDYTFYECRNLTKVTIPESVTDIGPYSFQNCTSLEEATFPNTVSTIWDNTFYGCTNLKEIIIPSSVTTVRSCAFCGCNSITELTVPRTVTSWYSAVFANCANLKKVTLEEGVTNTGNAYMFGGCTSLEDVSMPSTMTEFGSYTFGGCTSLKNFVYPDAMTNTGNCTFYECTGLENVTFSKNITEISNATFAYCTFEEMAVPEGVTTIGYQAFIRNPNLTTLTLPRTVESIDYWLIYDCPSMEKLYSLNPTPPVRGAHPMFEPFEEISENCVLYVPTGSKEAYSTADMWEGFFKDIIEVALVETSEATEVTASSAILNGAVTAGDTPITKKGFECWTDEKPEEMTTITISGDEMVYTIGNLTPETKYTYRAFAETSDGTFYGDDVVFTTLEDIPDGIDNVGMSSSNSENIEGIYSISGQKLNTTQKGVNIIRYSDGTTKKVIIK